MIENNILYGEGSNDDNLSAYSLQFNSSFLGSFKFESISKRRNPYANMYRKNQRLSQLSLHSALTT